MFLIGLCLTERLVIIHGQLHRSKPNTLTLLTKGRTGVRLLANTSASFKTILPP